MNAAHELPAMSSDCSGVLENSQGLSAMYSSVRLFLLTYLVLGWQVVQVHGQVVAVSNFSDNDRYLQRSEIAEFHDALYFSVGVEDTDQQELWRFDGQSLDLIDGGFWGTSELSLGGFTEFQGNLYFRGDQGTHGQELYRYDGQQVSLVADLQPGDASSTPVGLYVHDDSLYFSARVGDSFNHLYRYDGSEVAKVASFGNPRSSVVTGGSYQGNLIFGADDGDHGMELWQFDGDTVSMIADIYSGDGASFPREFLNVGDRLVFKATTPEHGQEIFQLDGSEVSILVDTNPGPKSSDSGYMTAVGDELYFSGVAWGTRFVYRTEGERVIKIMEGGGPIDVGNDELTSIRGKRRQGVEINELYSLDGDFYRSTVSSAASFETLNDNVYFSCDCPTRELFRLAKDGDANADGAVTFQDFLTISRNFGRSGGWDRGDFTNDGQIAFGDFLALSENFNKETPPALLLADSMQSVPEPAAGVWGGILALLMLARRRAKRSSRR